LYIFPCPSGEEEEEEEEEEEAALRGVPVNDDHVPP